MNSRKTPPRRLRWLRGGHGFFNVLDCEFRCFRVLGRRAFGGAVLTLGLTATLVTVGHAFQLITVGHALQGVPAGQPPAADPVVHTVRIDVVAVDARGAAINSLKLGDFDLREDGKPVAIDEARLVRINTTAAVGSVGGPAEGIQQPVQSVADEQRAARRDGTRLVAIYLDEYHISPGGAADRARDALIEFIDRELGPRDLVAVMKPLDSLFTIRLTHDREEARRIVAGLEGRKGDYTPRTTYERNYMVGSAARIETSRTQVTVSALQALAVHMGSLNDLRKTLLVVTEGLERVPGLRGQEYLATIDSLIRSANRANVSIYPIDPRPAPPTESSSAVLQSLASDTDGQTCVNADDLSTAMRRLIADASAYYVLTYHAAHKEDGKFYPVQVSMKTAGVHLRARSGYWAPSVDDRMRAELVARANAPPVRVPLEPARHISPLIQPWFGFSLGSGGKTRVTFVWEPSGRVPGDRLRQTAARLELTVLGAGDAVLFQGPVRPTGPGMVEDRGGESSRAIFDAAPGRLRLRTKVQDAARREVDSDVRELDIKDLRGAVALGTPEFLRARTAREFRALDADPDAVPVSSREFSRTERLLIRFPAYAPGGQPPSVSAKLMTRQGQAIRNLDVQPATDGENQIDVSLAGFAPGEYLIELTAASGANNATERVGFRVTS